MDKIEIRNILNSEYRDSYGRVTLRKSNLTDSSKGNYDNNNMHLFTGEAALLLKKLNILDEVSVKMTIDSILHTEITPGLYSRHPNPTPIPVDTVSHDEYNGIMYSCAAIPELAKTVGRNILIYGKHNFNSFNDKTPYLNIKPFLKYKPKLAITNLLRYMKDLYRKGTKNTVDSHYLPQIVSIRYTRQPRDIAFYKLICKKYPGILSYLYFLVSLMITTRRKSYIDALGSTQIMSLYKIWALDEVGHSNFLYIYVKQFFIKKMQELYGENYVINMHRRYFDQDKNHPLILLCGKL